MTTSEQLILEHLAEQISREDTERLFRWVRERPENAQEFARMASLHGHLRAQLSGERQARESGEFSRPPLPRAERAHAKPHRSVRLSIRYAVVAAIAACVVVAVGILYQARDDPAPKHVRDGRGPIVEPPDAGNPIVTVAQLEDAQWDDDAVLAVGDRLSTQTLFLKSGIVRLVFDRGAEVTLQGPIEFELSSLDRVRLDSGVLTATVPPGAKGFRVDTATVQIVDLGTAFGVRLDQDGLADVSVFEGEIEVTLPGTGDTQLLEEGRAVRAEAGGGLQSIDFDARPYEKLWPVVSGIVRLTGAFRLMPPGPRPLHPVRSNDTIYVLPEGPPAKLQAPMKVNISKPGKYRRQMGLTETELPAGSRVRKYLLHFNPSRGARQPRPEHAVGDITFDRPVLGLIVLGDDLDASDPPVSGPAKRPRPPRQLELRPGGPGDVIRLSDDRRTVHLDLTAVSRFPDHVRVIVDASPARQGEP